MPDNVGLLRRTLRGHADRLAAVVRAFDTLEVDLEQLERKDRTTYFAIDFHDLRSYLRQRLRSEDIVSERKLVQDYVRILLFAQLDQKLLLLPVYYEELKAHIKHRLAGASESALTQRVNDFRQRVRRELEDPDGILGYLERVSRAGLAPEPRVIREHTTQWLMRFGTLRRRMDSITIAAYMSRRFQALVENDRFVGLPEFLKATNLDQQGPIVVGKTDVWVYIKDLLDRRKGPSKWRQNSTDANAVALVHELNQRAAEQSAVVYIVSSARTLVSAVQGLNANVLAVRGRRVELRDFVYWNLWFAIALRNPELSRPSLADFQRQAIEFKPALLALSERCGQLTQELLAVNSSISELEPSSRELSKSLNETLSRLFEPSLDAQWLSRLATDTLAPDLNELHVAKVLRQIEDLVSRIGTASIDLKSELENLARLLQELFELFLKVERAAAKTVTQLASQEGEFMDGWMLDESTVDTPHRLLMELMENEGLSALPNVFGTLTGAGTGTASRLVLARAQMIAGRYDAAALELASIPHEDEHNPDVMFARAMLLERQGDFEKAHNLLSELLLIAPRNAAVHLHLAWILRKKYSRHSNDSTLSDLMLNLTLARDYAKGKSLPTEIRAAVLLYETIGSLARAQDRELMIIGLEELEKLSIQASEKSLAEELRRSIHYVMGRLSETIKLRPEPGV